MEIEKKGIRTEWKIKNLFKSGLKLCKFFLYCEMQCVFVVCIDPRSSSLLVCPMRWKHIFSDESFAVEKSRQNVSSGVIMDENLFELLKRSTLRMHKLPKKNNEVPCLVWTTISIDWIFIRNLNPSGFDSTPCRETNASPAQVSVWFQSKISKPTSRFKPF